MRGSRHVARCNGGYIVQDVFPVRLSAFDFRFSTSAFRLFGFPGSKWKVNHYQLARPFYSYLKPCLTMGKRTRS